MIGTLRLWNSKYEFYVCGFWITSSDGIFLLLHAKCRHIYDGIISSDITVMWYFHIRPFRLKIFGLLIASYNLPNRNIIFVPLSKMFIVHLYTRLLNLRVLNFFYIIPTISINYWPISKSQTRVWKDNEYLKPIMTISYNLELYPFSAFIGYPLMYIIQYYSKCP